MKSFQQQAGATPKRLGTAAFWLAGHPNGRCHLLAEFNAVLHWACVSFAAGACEVEQEEDTVGDAEASFSSERM